MAHYVPIVHELPSPPSIAAALRSFAAWPRVILFDSARVQSPLGRYSFLTADPIAWDERTRAEFGCEPLTELRGQLATCPAERIPDLPPFQGGAAGMLGYELGRCWERLPTAVHDEFQLPALAAGIYDWVLAWDHQQGRAWIISQGWPELEDRERDRRAGARLADVLAALNGVSPSFPSSRLGMDSPRSSALHRAASPSEFRITAPHHPLPLLDGLHSNFTRDGYLAAVERVIEYIRAGDIFQANLAQRLLFPWSGSPLDLYLKLRTCNAAPFAGYMAVDEWTILSASPERFLQVQQRQVTTRPIKGTRQRRFPPEADLFTQDELQVSTKDVAENVMIVDLLRNDLSRVCRPGSIRVPQLCTVETYETVHHLVSEVQGDLADGRDAWDLLAATFPGGSITGCPKVRAMEIITALEQTARGPYCGSLFYLGPDGTFDSSILIRTLTHRHGWLQLPVGGGVIVQSDPAAEYEETLHKAAGMMRALR